MTKKRYSRASICQVCFIYAPFVARRTFLVVLALLATTCELTATEQEHLGPIRVSVVPEISEVPLKHTYELLFDYLEKTTGHSIEPVFLGTYDEVLDAFIGGHIDLAFLGAYPYVVAQSTVNAAPLVMRDIDTRSSTYFIARADSPHDSVEDFKGETFAFGAELSTSGHLMPRHYLLEQSIVPKEFFSVVRYSGKHDMTATWVEEGEVALGAINASIFDTMMAEGKLNSDKLKIVSQTPRYADNVWTVRADLDESTRAALTDALLDLIPQESPGREVLERLQAEYFVSARESDFTPLVGIVEQLGLLDPYHKI